MENLFFVNFQSYVSNFVILNSKRHEKLTNETFKMDNLGDWFLCLILIIVLSYGPWLNIKLKNNNLNIKFYIIKIIFSNLP